ncbi:MAG: 16S rRNA (guanine(527)-N(7))-methyltransferase RsmG [Ruminococcus sp.]|nr:16S rRNA (guanine(527)-N(7))-methyltransferase RsmG [Ruminococcus sp.]
MLLSKSETDKIFGEYGLRLSDEQYERLYKYADLLVQWNEKINLTAITDPEGITVKHFFDSIYPFTLFELPQNSSIIDVGTGAGFPSCPLKIYRDDLKITLLDSLNKRVNFLGQVSECVGLGADCIHGRAEELGKNPQYREQFDCATARAVANLTELCEYCLPFVKTGGVFAALKGSGGEEELHKAKNAVKILGGKVEETKNYKLPNGDGRTLILIRKISETPDKYPRNKGQMKKKPF